MFDLSSFFENNNKKVKKLTDFLYRVWLFAHFVYKKVLKYTYIYGKI